MDTNEETPRDKNHWRCRCGCRHAIEDDACPLCGQRRSEVFRLEMDAALGEASE